MIKRKSDVKVDTTNVQTMRRRKGQKIEGYKNNTLVMFGCNHCGFFAKHRIDKNLDFVELGNNNYHFFTFVRPERLEKTLKNKTKFTSLIDGSDYMKSDSWKKSLEILDDLFSQYHFNKVIIAFTPLIDAWSFGNEDNLEGLYKNIVKDDKYGFSFSSIKNYYRRIMVEYYLNRNYNVPIVQFVDDPLELSFHAVNPINKRFFYYDCPRVNAEYFPYVEYGFIYKRNKDQTFEYKKEYDFVFGMTSVMTSVPYRFNMIGKLLELEKDFDKEGITYKHFFKDKQRKINTYVNGFDYNDKYIAAARYTMVIPAYCENEFSLIRFHEAVDRACIPLIHKDSKWQHVYGHLPKYKEIIEKYDLLVTEEELIKKIKALDYQKIIDELRACEDYQKFLDISFYENYKKRYQQDIF